MAGLPAGTDSSGRLTPTRRAVLAGAGAVAVAVLGGCATYDQNEPAAGPDDSGAQPDLTDPNQTPKPLAQTSDIPVGGGRVIENKRVVVTQPTKGEFKCFTAVCTHQGCLVSEVQKGTINCPCHGSKFKIADGSVANGPATRPCSTLEISIEGGDIRFA